MNFKTYYTQNLCVVHEDRRVAAIISHFLLEVL